MKIFDEFGNFVGEITSNDRVGGLVIPFLALMVVVVVCGGSMYLINWMLEPVDFSPFSFLASPTQAIVTVLASILTLLFLALYWIPLLLVTIPPVLGPATGLWIGVFTFTIHLLRQFVLPLRQPQKNHLMITSTILCITLGLALTCSLLWYLFVIDNVSIMSFFQPGKYSGLLWLLVYPTYESIFLETNQFGRILLVMSFISFLGGFIIPPIILSLLEKK